MRLELPFGRMGVAVGLLLAHVLVLFGLFKIARRPAPPPAPVSIVSFITTTSKQKPVRPPQMVQATATDVSLPIPATPAIDVPPPIATAPEVIATPPEPVEVPVFPAVIGPAEPSPRVVESVMYVREPVIRYPLQSRRQREQGVVLFEVLVDERGMPVKIEIERSSGYPRLDEAGREAVQQSRFRPYTENGVARSCVVLVPLRFALKRR